jgi:hypothetical protein
MGSILLIAVPGASAAARFASPSGSGTTCSSAQPCDVVTAVNGAATNDDITIEAGTYGSPTPIATTLDDEGKKLTIHGQAGQPRPVIVSGAGIGVELLGNGSRLSNVDIEDPTGQYGIFVNGAYNADIDHVIAHTSAANSTACYVAGTVVDSVCWSSGSSGTGATLLVIASATVALRNDTVIASGSGGNAVVANGTAGSTMTINLYNTIARGAGADILVSTDSNPASKAAVSADHSNYANVQIANGGGGSLTSVTPAGSASNQTGLPVFVNAAAGNFHEQASSVATVDLGENSPLNGTTDLDGNPRALAPPTACGQNPVTDIGAYELVEPSVAACRPPLTLPDTRITAAKISAKKGAVTFSFQGSGTVSGFECALQRPRRKHHKKPKLAYSKCNSPKTYKHLRPGNYVFKVRAFNAAGADSTPAIRKVKIKPTKPA